MRSTPRLLAAALLPLLVSAVLLQAYLSPARPLSQPEETRLIERRLAMVRPELLLLGNSAGHVAIDGPIAARALSIKGLYATLKDSTAPTWYATLSRRVYAQGYRPKIVVVAGPEGALTAVSPETTHDLDYLLQISGSEDPEIVERVGGRGPLGALRYRVMARRAAWRRAAVDLAGRQMASVLFGSLLRIGSSDHIFVPVDREPLGGLAVGEVEGDGMERPIEETFLPLFCDLAAQHESELIVVRIPSRAEVGTPESARSARIAAYLSSRGVRYLDDLGSGLTVADYQDSYHVTGQGRRLFTRALLEALQGADQNWK